MIFNDNFVIEGIQFLSPGKKSKIPIRPILRKTKLLKTIWRQINVLGNYTVD
jgi:hypothetical protein